MAIPVFVFSAFAMWGISFTLWMFFDFSFLLSTVLGLVAATGLFFAILGVARIIHLFSKASKDPSRSGPVLPLGRRN
ncbi:hypothetical protein [Leisingera sp.]|uniref:hypothetical protein n=1 Tax=Leisingera sp. TaxID=1879318 RepID=UPI003A9017F6